MITSTSFPSLLVILASYIFSTPPQPRIYLISILSTLTSSHDSLSAPAFSREFAVDFLEALDLFDITTPCPRVRLQQWTATCYLCVKELPFGISGLDRITLHAYLLVFPLTDVIDRNYVYRLHNEL